MRYYQQMLDTALSVNGRMFDRVPGEFGYNGGLGLISPAGGEVRDKFFRLMKEAEIFVFENTRDYVDTIKWEDFDGVPSNQIEALELDLPFKTCFFESLDGPIMFDKEEISDQEYQPSHTVGLLVHEISPRQYEFFNLSFVPEECYRSMAEFVRRGLVEGGSDAPPLEQIIEEFRQDIHHSRNTIWYWNTTLWPRANLWGHVVCRLLSKLKQEDVGTDQVSRKVWLRIGGEKVKRKISQVIRVCPKAAVKNLKPIGHHEVDWGQRWVVRGHWRRLGDGQIGKNRAGEYNTVGFTWVVPYVKGPEDKPLIKKERLVVGPSVEAGEV